MAVDDALVWMDPAPGDPRTNWVSQEDVKQMIRQVYTDLSTAQATVVVSEDAPENPVDGMVWVKKWDGFIYHWVVDDEDDPTVGEWFCDNDPSWAWTLYPTSGSSIWFTNVDGAATPTPPDNTSGWYDPEAEPTITAVPLDTVTECLGYYASGSYGPGTSNPPFLTSSIEVDITFMDTELTDGSAGVILGGTDEDNRVWLGYEKIADAWWIKAIVTTDGVAATVFSKDVTSDIELEPVNKWVTLRIINSNGLVLFFAGAHFMSAYNDFTPYYLTSAVTSHNAGFQDSRRGLNVLALPVAFKHVGMQTNFLNALAPYGKWPIGWAPQVQWSFPRLGGSNWSGY